MEARVRCFMVRTTGGGSPMCNADFSLWQQVDGRWRKLFFFSLACFVSFHLLFALAVRTEWAVCVQRTVPWINRNNEKRQWLRTAWNGSFLVLFHFSAEIDFYYSTVVVCVRDTTSPASNGRIEWCVAHCAHAKQSREMKNIYLERVIRRCLFWDWINFFFFSFSQSVTVRRVVHLHSVRQTKN